VWLATTTPSPYIKAKSWHQLASVGKKCKKASLLPPKGRFKADTGKTKKMPTCQLANFLLIH
jgi:hypothetical protein